MKKLFLLTGIKLVRLEKLMWYGVNYHDFPIYFDCINKIVLKWDDRFIISWKFLIILVHSLFNELLVFEKIPAIIYNDHWHVFAYW